MIGLMVLLFFAVYLAISIAVTITVAVRVKRHPWLWGGLAAFVMYNLVFWDWIPTLVMHKYYCDTQAGFWVYKTPEQWKKENPGVAETMVPTKDAPTNKLGYILNQRFTWAIKQENFPLSLVRRTEEVIDMQTNASMARYVDFKTGYGGFGLGGDGTWRVLKFWLADEYCYPDKWNDNTIGNFAMKFKRIGEAK